MAKSKRIIDELKDKSKGVLVKKKTKKLMISLTEDEYEALTKISKIFNTTKQALAHQSLENEGLLNLSELTEIEKATVHNVIKE